jgi:hypothetical protein
LPVEQLNGIPQPLVVLLEVLLAKDPVRRFQTPAELLKVMPTVREAINAERAVMKTIRVFVSSTPWHPVGPDLKDAGWKRARLGNRLRNWLGVGPLRQE